MILCNFPWSCLAKYEKEITNPRQPTKIPVNLSISSSKKCFSQSTYLHIRHSRIPALHTHLHFPQRSSHDLYLGGGFVTFLITNKTRQQSAALGYRKIIENTIEYQLRH